MAPTGDPAHPQLPEWPDQASGGRPVLTVGPEPVPELIALLGRWRALTSFVAERTPGELCPESWDPGQVSDAGNQEQVSWFVGALASIGS